MKKAILKVCCLINILAAAMSITYGSTAVQAADDISVTIDGKELSFDVEPQITDGRTMVPMRAIFEALGADVYWDSISNTATGIKGSTVVIIGIGSNKLYKNDATVELDVPAALVDGRTLVPVRAVSEAFDCTVSWSDSTRTVSITTAIPDYKNEIPPYSGEPYIVINGNKAYFDPSELITEPFENYSELDELGRCGAAYANICKDLMPTEERGSIGSVKPTGWHTVKYDFVEGKYLYNRCHLIGFQLAGENANKKNLITGTRYLNVSGMLPFENLVADYVKETDNHVLYRVTPIFEGDNLIADGVLMEAESVEDNGEGVSFNVFCYNVQPGVVIDYVTGESYAENGTLP
ncbi:MAG: stalk domain-containing protein [Candidatus Ornithomonoglobus sp.]